MEWTLPAGEDRLAIPHDQAYDFPEGFRATIRFSCDFTKIRPGRFANLVTKGSDYDRGWSLMLRQDGWLLVNLAGLESGKAYHLSSLGLQSDREYALTVIVRPGETRVFVDGVEKGSYRYRGSRDFSRSAGPLQIGTMGGYRFFGRLHSVKLESVASLSDLPPPLEPLPEYRLEPPAEQAAAHILWTRSVWAPPDRYVGWPTVCRLKNGTILAVFSGDREGHVCPWGKIQMVRSEDDGETWSAAQTIANGPVDDRDAGVMELPNGEVLVTYFTSIYYRNLLKGAVSPSDPKFAWKRHDEKIPEDVWRSALGYFAVRSSDGGRTWGVPVRLDVKGNTPHAPALCADGTLFALLYRSGGGMPEGRRDVFGGRSADGGRTWTCVGGPVSDPARENAVADGYNEPAVVECADGSLLGLIRYHHGDCHLRQTRSTDGGKTWSVAERTPMLGYPAHLLRLPDGTLVCSYGRRAEDDYGEHACLSHDNGRTWEVENEILLARGFGPDLGYPSTCLCRDGALLTVYYQQPAPGRLCALMATKWRLR